MAILSWSTLMSKDHNNLFFSLESSVFKICTKDLKQMKCDSSFMRLLITNVKLISVIETFA